MMDRKKSKLTRVFFYTLTAGTTLSIALLGFLWITSEFRRFHRESEALRAEYLSDQQKQIKGEVESIVEFIQFKRSQIVKRLKRDIRNRTGEAVQIAMNIYAQNRDSKPDSEIKSMIKDALRPVRFNNGRGYFFAVSMDGVEELYPVRPDLEGKNLLDLQDSKGTFVIRHEIEIVRQNGEGYVADYWPKPDHDPSVAHAKISFVRYVPQLDWYIGTGEYLEDVENDIQLEVLDWLDNVQIGQNRNVFAGQWDGLSLSGPAVGRNMIGVTDINGFPVVRELIRAARNGGGFVHYVMPDVTGKRSAPKLSYAAGIPDWQWYVGAGVYIDEIDRIIAEQRHNLESQVKFQIMQILLALSFLLLLALLTARFFSSKIEKSLNSLNQFFNKAASQAVHIEPGDLSYTEFESLAEAANAMIDQRLTAENQLRESREEWRAILNNAHLGIYRVTMEGRFIFINPRMAEMLNYNSPEEFIEKVPNIIDLYVNPDDRKLLLEELSQEGFVADKQIQFKSKGGKEIWVTASVRLVENQSDSPILEGFLLDITDRIAFESALKESEERYRKLIESNPDAIIIHRDRKILFVNQAAIQLLGAKQADDLLGLDFYELVHPDMRDQLLKRKQQVMAGERIPLLEVQYQRIDGRTIDLEVTGSMVSGEHGIALQTIARDISDRKGIEKKHKQSEERYRSLVENTMDGYFVCDIPSGNFIFLNQRICDLFQYSMSEALSLTLWDVVDTAEHIRVRQRIQSRLDGENIAHATDIYNVVTSKGSRFRAEVSTSLVTYEGKPVVQGIFRDITEKEKLEKQLLRAQKMESIGRLAGGVAHDFNNMLGVIIGRAELAMTRTTPGEPAYYDFEEILKAAQRSANLTNQLLAFARRQAVDATIVDLNDTISGMIKMLRKLIGEEIDLFWMPGAKLWPVKMDPTQIDQIVVNLCINARDSIGGVGKITIETKNLMVEDTMDIESGACPPGSYVMLRVTDDGKGMDADTLGNIFEPFFSTKDVGEGTGLGLSMIYGIIKQNNGFISVSSEPGQGATFQIYLPKTNEATETHQDPAAKSVAEGTETILVVEDEAMILNLCKAMLERLGYKVLTACSPHEALQSAESYKAPIHLMITDVVMPEMDGQALAKKIQVITPGIKVLYMSGYTDDIIVDRGVLNHTVGFLAKPFSIHSLSGKVRELLDRPT